MDKDMDKLQSDLRVAQAFLKAHEELKANEEARQKRIYEKAVKAAEERKKKREEAQNPTKTRFEPSEELKAYFKEKFGIDLDHKNEKE